jgi:hypothetical protein
MMKQTIIKASIALSVAISAMNVYAWDAIRGYRGSYYCKCKNGNMGGNYTTLEAAQNEETGCPHACEPFGGLSSIIKNNIKERKNATE